MQLKACSIITLRGTGLAGNTGTTPEHTVLVGIPYYHSKALEVVDPRLRDERHALASCAQPLH